MQIDTLLKTENKIQTNLNDFEMFEAMWLRYILVRPKCHKEKNPTNHDRLQNKESYPWDCFSS